MDTAHNEAGSASPVEGRRLYISNLVHTITEADLQSFFTGYFIESISIPRPRKDRRTGHAFVDLSTPSEAERAVAELSGKMILDRGVSVQRARKSKHNADVRHPSSDTVTHRSSSGSDQALEAALQEQVRAEAESHKQSDEEMDVEDSHAPDPSQLTPEITPNSVEGSSSIPEVVVRSDDEEVRATQLPDVQSPTINTEMELGEENDDYEPPEATRTVNAPSPIESPPFSPAPPDSVTDFEPFSIGRSGFENLTQSKSEDLPTNGSVPGEVIRTSPFLSGLLIIWQDSGEKSNPMQFFTPYESPLKYFRAYRFHPDYAQQVRGGLKSLTYSHKIDPKAEFCRYELAGGVCNDKTCDFQHFKDIVLPGASVEASSH
jgi:RNA recognition motif-containing protein